MRQQISYTQIPYYEVKIRTERELLVRRFHKLDDALEYYNKHVENSIYARLREHWEGYARFIKFYSRSY